MSSPSPEPFRVGVVGGGLVGSLEACLLARRGYKVVLFEARDDSRHNSSYRGRSMNLALSHRGISALKRLNFDYVVQEHGIPMGGRMLHDRMGKQKPLPYDPDGRCIHSIERAGLNHFLLDKAEKEFKVEIKFNHRLVDMDANKAELVFRLDEKKTEDSRGESSEQLYTYQFDLIVGCDGARSSVRSLLARQSQMGLTQEFIEHVYLEIHIDPDQKGGFRMSPNHLHIWPRGEYMMIALPNKDYSFTCNLFMPSKILNTIQDPEEALRFFQKNLPDSIELVGATRIKETISKKRPSSLMSVKCNPYHYKDKVILLGDSAHAMLPFYGQGMNCGFEDCLVLDELLDQHLGSSSNDHTITASNQSADVIRRVFEEFSRQRCPNGHSMSELSTYNYLEMSELVTNWSFLLRKHLDDLLYRIFPSKWTPLYTMVTFSRIPINECAQKRINQDKIIEKIWKLTLAHAALGLTCFAAFKARKLTMD